MYSEACVKDVAWRVAAQTSLFPGKLLVDQTFEQSFDYILGFFRGKRIGQQPVQLHAYLRSGHRTPQPKGQAQVSPVVGQWTNPGVASQVARRQSLIELGRQSQVERSPEWIEAARSAGRDPAGLQLDLHPPWRCIERDVGHQTIQQTFLGCLSGFFLSSFECLSHAIVAS